MNPKKYREKWNLTQKDLSNQAGITIGMLRKIENQKISIGAVSVDTAVRLSKAMGITVEEFIGKRLEVDDGILYEKDIEWFKKTD